MESILNDPTVVWYGPHACDVCNALIVRAAIERGGEKFDVPERLLRVFQCGCESGDIEVVYPQTWRPHVCKPLRKDLVLICSYCGHVTEFESPAARWTEEGRGKLRDHMLACPKRPEMELLGQIAELAAECARLRTARDEQSAKLQEQK